MTKGYTSNILRRLGLIQVSDRLRFYLQRYRNRNINYRFLCENPGISLPPDYLIYESFQINYHKYYTESIESAREITALLKKHADLSDIKILDWGCGPGRIIRHLPGMVSNNCHLYGTDYNEKSIEWCRKNIRGVNFSINSLRAELPFSDNYFDIIYGLSVLTHLSEQLHHEWYNELLRILKPGGLILLTTAGNNFKVKLTRGEKEMFDRGHIVVRGMAMEGHRTFSAFQPAEFMRILFSNSEILEHIETTPEKSRSLPQDVWIIRKRRN